MKARILAIAPLFVLIATSAAMAAAAPGGAAVDATTAWWSTLGGKLFILGIAVGGVICIFHPRFQDWLKDHMVQFLIGGAMIAAPAAIGAIWFGQAQAAAAWVF